MLLGDDRRRDIPHLHHPRDEDRVDHLRDELPLLTSLNVMLGKSSMRYRGSSSGLELSVRKTFKLPLEKAKVKRRDIQE